MAVRLVTGRGTYVLSGTPPVFATAARLGGVLSHSSAALLHGFALWNPDPTIHVTVGSGSRDAEPGVRLHRARLPRADVDPSRPLTTPLRTVLDCARTMPLVDAVVILDSALHRGKVKLEDLQAAADAARGQGAGALRRAVRLVDPRAASPLESVLRLGLGILNCVIQSQVHIEDVGDVDFVLDGWLAIEGDGFEFHSDRHAYRDDRSRGNGLVLRRHVLLRFTYEDVRYGMEEVLELVAQVLAAGPPAGQAAGTAWCSEASCLMALMSITELTVQKAKNVRMVSHQPSRPSQAKMPSLK